MWKLKVDIGDLNCQILNSWPTDIRNICELKTVTIYIPEGTEL